LSISLKYSFSSAFAAVQITQATHVQSTTFINCIDLLFCLPFEVAATALVNFLLHVLQFFNRLGQQFIVLTYITILFCEFFCLFGGHLTDSFALVWLDTVVSLAEFIRSADIFSLRVTNFNSDKFFDELR